MVPESVRASPHIYAHIYMRSVHVLLSAFDTILLSGLRSLSLDFACTNITAHCKPLGYITSVSRICCCTFVAVIISEHKKQQNTREYVCIYIQRWWGAESADARPAATNSDKNVGNNRIADTQAYMYPRGRWTSWLRGKP